MCTALALAQSLFFSPDAWGAPADALDELRALPFPQLGALLERLIAERRVHIRVDAAALAKLIDCQVITHHRADARDCMELREPTLTELLDSVQPVVAAANKKPRRTVVVVKARQLPKRPNRQHPWKKAARDGAQKRREQHGQAV